MPLIVNLKKACKEVFPNVEYGYTTIPTYPSGQIGFMVCSKDANSVAGQPRRRRSCASTTARRSTRRHLSCQHSPARLSDELFLLALVRQILLFISHLIPRFTKDQPKNRRGLIEA
jgi:spermidine synthase